MVTKKAHTSTSGLAILLVNFKPMDSISTDIAEKVLSNGKKVHFLVIVDRSSGFISAYKPRGTNKNIL